MLLHLICAALFVAQTAPQAPSWDLSSEFSNGAAWEHTATQVRERALQFANLRKEPIRSPAHLARLLDEEIAVRGEAGALARYALLTFNLDTTDDAAGARFAAARQLESVVAANTAWLDTAVAAINAATLRRWIDSTPALQRHLWQLTVDRTRATYRYPNGTEAAYTALEREGGTASDVYDALSRGPLANDAQLGPYEEALGILMARRYEIDHVLARARGFDSGIDAAFALGDGLPRGSYRLMIQSARDHAATLRRFVKTWARLNNLATVHYEDLGRPLPAWPTAISLSQAQRWAVDSSAPLGADYQAYLRQLWTKPWFDFDPRPHKDDSVGVYWQVGGGHPLGIMSFEGTLGSARTVAAVGALTAFYSRIPVNALPTSREDDFPIYGNSIWFLSNLLLADYLVRTTPDRASQVAVLAADVRRLQSQYFANVIATDFEDRMEHLIAAGTLPSGRQLSALYLQVVHEYYGDGVVTSESTGREWMTLGNMYYGHVKDEFAFAAATAVAMQRQIAMPNAKAIAAVVNPMQNPLSLQSFGLLRDAGADPTDRATYDAVETRMNADMDALDRLLKAS